MQGCIPLQRHLRLRPQLLVWKQQALTAYCNNLCTEAGSCSDYVVTGSLDLLTPGFLLSSAALPVVLPLPHLFSQPGASRPSVSPH